LPSKGRFPPNTSFENISSERCNPLTKHLLHRMALFLLGKSYLKIINRQSR
jgi:hypothetical protein